MNISGTTCKINPFGNEDTKYITFKNMDSIIDDVESYGEACSTPSKLIQLIHFHQEHPENHNMKIKDNEVFIYDGNTWTSKDKTETINKLAQKSYNMIVNYYNRRKILFLKRNIILREKKKLIEKFPPLEDSINSLLENMTTIQLDINPLLHNGNFETTKYKKTILDIYTSDFLNSYFKIKQDLTNIINLDPKEKTKLLKKEKQFEDLITTYQSTTPKD